MTTSKTLGFALVVASASAGILGCSPDATDASETATAGALVTQRGAGFFHTFARSKFHAGVGPHSVRDLGRDKVIGSEGAFAVDPRNRSMRAILNGDSPALTSFKPLTTDGAVHDGATLAYFKAAGLPADQIESVRALPSMRGGTSALGKKAPEEFTGFASVIHRAIGGIPVPDSFAWAIFNADGEVIQEAVHWPDVPEAAIVGATDLQATIAAPAGLKALKDRLPAEAARETGGVVIRHGNTDDADPAPFACYDVYVKARGNRGRTRHYDGLGNERMLAVERPKGVSTPKQP